MWGSSPHHQKVFAKISFGGEYNNFMQRKPSKLYEFHVANLSEIEHSIRAVERFARNEVGLGNPENSLQSLLRLYAFLIGAWAETRLNKLLHEEFGFSKEERALITAKKNSVRTVD